ncbi:MAG: hypothetical protein JEZ09_09270 [Salinivirgaceae bacterium]|nr:hypothetical protein [Salinivirgaceae bacterium]
MTTAQNIDEIKASLKERIKELECLYNISEIAYVKLNSPISEIFSDILEILPAGWQYPEITCARIYLDNKSYYSQNYVPSNLKQRASIFISNTERGFVEILYKENRPKRDEGPFLKEERALINSIVKKLTLIIERHEDREAKKILESKLIHADRLVTIGELTAGIAHELNEPLGSILGFAQLIKSGDDLSEQSNQDLDKIVNASIHAREVIRKLMVFSKYEEKPSQNVNLNSIINDGLYLLESRCQKESVEIIRMLEKDIPNILANPVQMHQVIVNLCVNAIQAMPNGGKLILQTKTRSNHVVVVVQDTGIGISEDYLQKIFNPFFSLKDSETNTGLGLSVVHGIVSSFNGEIKVESNLGVGTRFEIIYPIYNES